MIKLKNFLKRLKGTIEKKKELGSIVAPKIII